MTAVMVVIVALVSWIGYREIKIARTTNEAIKTEAENLKLARYMDALRNLEMASEAGDDKVKEHCRHAIKMLELLEPDCHRSSQRMRKLQDWLLEIQPDKP